ncbi:MAG TPA: ATP-grasp domain-containing protein [Gemmatimonadales bacterium]|nr:ATP-grasp domain-containing protein [Gemmatimonadales bacterium]
MKVFVFEFFSGGGLLGQSLPPSLAREGDLMLGTLVGELARAEVEVLASRDPRLPPLAVSETLRPSAEETPEELFARGIAWADAVWPTAPEGEGTLERLAAAVTSAGRTLLGCTPEAIRLSTSKLATARALSARGIPVVPTYGAGDPVPSLPGPWVVKPDDGAGCDGLELLDGSAAALNRIRSPGAALVAQPWVDGDGWSLSLLCAAGRATLLACNRQRLTWRAGRLDLDALEVNARPPGDPSVARLGAEVAAAIPGLWGYVGVDFVLGAGGPLVVDVNPRLTTSYCGLPAALGRNVAAMVLELGRSGALPAPTTWSGSVVDIVLHPVHA